jgi:hypothetical protein
MVTSSIKGLPAQMLPQKTKEKDKWIRDNMDRLEQIGRTQFNENLKLLENYEMVGGKFIASHYFETNEYSDLLSQLTREFDLPHYLRHYDIIGPIINTMSGEMQEHPDSFRIRRYDEGFSNIYIREKTRRLMAYVKENLQTEIDKALIDMGYDPSGKSMENASPEEKQQYMQMMDQQRQELTPPEIESYMKTEWNDIAEIWGQHQQEHDNEHFNRRFADKIEFEDVLKSARCFKHFCIMAGRNYEETWNPITTFHHKSPGIANPEDGDYIGQQFYLTPSAIVDRLGEFMTAEQIKQLDEEDDEYTKGSQDAASSGSGTDAYGVSYGSIMPFLNYPDYKIQKDSLGFDPLNPIVPLDTGIWQQLVNSNYTVDTRGLGRITQGYWKTKVKQGYYTYIDKELGMIRNIIVDEDFEWPQGTRIYNNKLWQDYKDIPNTLTWTWTDQVYQGWKVSRENTNLEEDLYLDVRPADLQLENEFNPAIKKLPVCGCFSNARNMDPVAMVDLVKPDQIGHNVAMNQLYQLMEREVGKFLIMDVNLFPTFKDWAGEQGYEKFISVARALGITVADTSPGRARGANAGGQLPKMIDLDETSRMLSRLRIAAEFEQAGKRRVGVSDQRTGDIGKDETATGVQQGIAKSYTQTRSYFTTFFEYKRRYLRMALDTALFVQQHNPDICLTYGKSDLTRAFFTLSGPENLTGVKLNIYATDSQEALRQTELIRQMFMNNNNLQIAPPDLVTIITSNSPAEMKIQLEKSYQKQQDMQAQQQQLEQQKVQMAQQEQERVAKWEREKFYAELDNKKEVAYIQTFVGRNATPMQDVDNDQIPDILEYDKLTAKMNSDLEKVNIAKEKNKLQERKMDQDKQISNKQMNLKQQEIKQRGEIADKQLEIAKANKNKYDKPSSRKK